MTPLTGIVLAGGRSRRMGRDKADIVLAGRTLLERAAELLEPFCAEVIVVGRAGAPRCGVRAIADEPPGLGPVGGLCTGLAAIRSPRALCIGVDLPLMTPELLGSLLAAADAGHDAAVFRLGGAVEPLPGVYAAAVLPTIRRCLREGCYRMQDVLGAVRTVYVPLEETPPSRAAFLNVNTPEALDEARRLLEGPRGAG